MLISEDKSEPNYEYGCLMLYLNLPNWEIITSDIDIVDLYESDSQRYGIETQPHVTILYGIHTNIEDSEVFSMFSDFRKSDIDLKFRGIDCFFNKDYDVLKINIISERLNELNGLAKTLPHTSEYPDYKPHVTIGYFQKGKAEHYMDPNFNDNFYNIEKIVYSKTDGKKICIPIN